MNKQRKILISFDVEEFDLPLEYNQYISPDEQMMTGKKGLDATMQVLDQHNISCTLFTTANFAQAFPLATKEASGKHEIASHAFYHSAFEPGHLLKSKLVLEKITGKPITGLRMPRMKPIAMKEVTDAGYTYDSSINPSFIPGRYNNFHLPRTLYLDDGMLRMPVSVSPHLRIPIFWLTFKNLPYPIFKMLARQTLKKDGYLCLYFHPWEFTDLSAYRIPFITKTKSGDQLQEKLHRLIHDLSKEGDCITINQYIAALNRDEVFSIVKQNR